MSTLISVVRVKIMDRLINLSFLVGYCEIMQRWGPLGAHNPCLATGSPPGCGNCSLPLTNNNLTHISTSEYSLRNLPLAFPLCSPAVTVNTGHCQADRPPPVKHTVHCFFSLCGRSLSCTAAWGKLSGNFYLNIPKECNSFKLPLSERKMSSLWALESQQQRDITLSRAQPG